MPPINFEQALYRRPDGETPSLLARSARFDDAWLPDAERLMLGFGNRPGRMACPPTVFALPIGSKQVAVVRVIDDSPDPRSMGLRFHFLVVERKVYEAWICDPFMLADKIEPTWDATGELPGLQIPENTFSARTVATVQDVLRRVKPSALREGANPDSPDFERTSANSESPALLGGAQILVDGGRLVFERRQGDMPLVSGLWLLLPEMTRCRLWPTSFAFSQELEFDVLVVPYLNEMMLESYTTEEQAADYPEGTYELALQRAAENNSQPELDAAFRRRDGNQTLRLAILLLILVSGVVLASRLLGVGDP